MTDHTPYRGFRLFTEPAPWFPLWACYCDDDGEPVFTESGSTAAEAEQRARERVDELLEEMEP